MKIRKNTFFYYILRLIYIFARPRANPKKVRILELYVFLINLLLKLRNKHKLANLHFEQDYLYVLAENDINLTFNTDYNLPLGVGQSLEFVKDHSINMAQEFILPYIPNGTTYIDVGANNGLYYSLIVAKEKPDVEILCFEPHTGYKKILEHNVRLNEFQNIAISPYALAEFDGEMFLQASHGASGCLKKENADGTAIVQVRKLDSIYQDKKKISFIKIDIEGFELQFLKGAIEALQKHAPFLLMELDDKLLSKNGNTSEHEVIQFLKKLKYNVYRIKNSRDAFCVPQAKEGEILETIKDNIVNLNYK